VGENPFRRQMGQTAGGGHVVQDRLVPLPVVEKAHPGHAGVHLQVHPHPHPRGLGRGVQLLGVGTGEHRLGDGKLGQPPCLLRRGKAEDENVPIDACPAQLHGLLQVGDPEPGRARFPQGFGGGGGAVAVAVRLDHRHGLAAGGQGGLYRLKIPLQTVQVNLRPGAFQEFGHEKPAAFRVFFRSIAHACCVYAIHYTLFFAINQTFSLGFRLCPSFPILRGEGDGISCFYLFPFRGIYGNIKSIHGQGGAPALYRMK